MQLKSTIQFGKLTGYDDNNFAIVELNQWDDDPLDRTLEELMISCDNSLSQNLPIAGDNVVIAFDEAGEGILLGSYSGEIAPRPSENIDDIIFNNGTISLKLNGDGKIEIKNQNEELIDLVVQLIDLLLNSTTATAIGAQKLSISLPDATSSVLGQLKTKVESFKV